MLRYLINFLYPPRCAACELRLPVDSTRRVCAECIARIERIPEPVCLICGIPLGNASRSDSNWCDQCAKSPPHYGAARAVTRYAAGDGPTVSAIIRRYKYGLDQSLAHALAECLGDPIAAGGQRLRHCDSRAAASRTLVLARIQPGRAARRGRGGPARATAGRGQSGARAFTPAQTMQDHRERLRNVRGAFAVKKPERVANRRVLLVDDVMTTGATADECARALLAAGARRVDVLTLARAI